MIRPAAKWMQLFIKRGRDHPFDAVGLVAAMIVFITAATISILGHVLSEPLSIVSLRPWLSAVAKVYHRLICSLKVQEATMGVFRWLGAVALAIALSGCFESKSTLSQDDQKFLDAVMYFFTGLEDNLDETDGKGMPWQRAVKGRSIEYWRIGRNGIGFSDDEMSKKTRDSQFVRYINRLTSPEPCVFSFGDVTEFSKGDSKEDFSAYSSGNIGNTMTFNLTNAHTFTFEDDGYGEPYVKLLGPRVMCLGPYGCENVWTSVFSGLSLGRFRGKIDQERRQKAFSILKKACPGKEF
jgi:hypothetical protein